MQERKTLVKSIGNWLLISVQHVRLHELDDSWISSKGRADRQSYFSLFAVKSVPRIYSARKPDSGMGFSKRPFFQNDSLKTAHIDENIDGFP